MQCGRVSVTKQAGAWSRYTLYISPARSYVCDIDSPPASRRAWMDAIRASIVDRIWRQVGVRSSSQFDEREPPTGPEPGLETDGIDDGCCIRGSHELGGESERDGTDGTVPGSV